jgi:hypothetical protein
MDQISRQSHDAHLRSPQNPPPEDSPIFKIIYKAE